MSCVQPRLILRKFRSQRLLMGLLFVAMGGVMASPASGELEPGSLQFEGIDPEPLIQAYKQSHLDAGFTLLPDRIGMDELTINIEFTTVVEARKTTFVGSYTIHWSIQEGKKLCTPCTVYEDGFKEVPPVQKGERATVNLMFMKANIDAGERCWRRVGKYAKPLQLPPRGRLSY